MVSKTVVATVVLVVVLLLAGGFYLAWHGQSSKAPAHAANTTAANSSNSQLNGLSQYLNAGNESQDYNILSNQSAPDSPA